ncbi:MAG: lasso peptide biosynthesis B2 protein [Vicinamibacterales bacterium]
MSPAAPRGYVLRRLGQEVRTVSDAILVTKALAWALVLPALKRVVSVKSLAAVMHQPQRRATRDADRERRIITFAQWGARLTRWNRGANCLERSLIAYRYLCAAGAHPTLVIGVGRDPAGVIGHAWVLVDGQLVGEPQSAIASYTPAFAFGPDGHLDAEPPPSAPHSIPAS